MKLVYIAGEARSGTTLLARILGASPGALNVGELLQYVSTPGLRERSTFCGCGAPYKLCQFWSKYSQGDGLPDFSLHAPPLRLRSWGALRKMVERGDPAVTDFNGKMSSFLSTIATDNNCETIVDASKSPLMPLCLASSDEVELHVIHLVRHVQDVVSSMSRQKGYLQKHNKLRTTATWIYTNKLGNELERICTNYQRVRFEDFLKAPGETIELISDKIGYTENISEFVRDNRVYLEDNHAVAGNPDKFESGWTEVTAPKRASSDPPYLLAGILARPLLKKYGYA